MDDENIYTTPEDFNPDDSFKRLLEHKVEHYFSGDAVCSRTLLEALIDLYRVVQMMGQAVHALQVDFVQLLSQLVIEEQAQAEPSPHCACTPPEGSQN